MKTQIDISEVCVETKRLILRPWRMNDLEDFFEYCSDPLVGKMAGWPHHVSIAESQEMLELFVREPCVFALELKENGKAIGSLGIDWLDADSELNNAQVMILSYDLNRAYWGREFMPEAVSAIIPYCFKTLKADYLYCGALNDQSQRVAEKCGFHFWKEREYRTHNSVETERIHLLPNQDKE